MTKTIQTITIATILLAGLVAPAFTNNAFAIPTELVVNGSFEDPDCGFCVESSILGWSSTNLIEIRDNIIGTASDGDQFVELDVHENSAMFQTLDTIDGENYILSFDYSPRINKPASTNIIEVYWDGDLVDSLTEQGSAVNVWDTYTYIVEASGSSTVLEFRAAGADDSFGGNIDAVSVIHELPPVPPNAIPDCSEAEPSQALLWPPNHKFVPITIDGITDFEGDSITVNITGITQDEELNAKGKGDGNTSPDGTGVGTDTAEVRAERAGTGDGRVYEISFTADDGNGGSCTGSVEVGVPHNKKSTPEDSGQNFYSTG